MRHGTNWEVFFKGLSPTVQQQFRDACKPIKTRRYPSKFGSTTPGRHAHVHGTPQPIELGVFPKFYKRMKDGSIRRGEAVAA